MATKRQISLSGVLAGQIPEILVRKAYVCLDLGPSLNARGMAKMYAGAPTSRLFYRTGVAVGL